MKTPAHTQQGFTLIEVLVALTLMALVSLISWRGLDAVQQTGERLDERSEEILSWVRALDQLERDVLLHADGDILPGLPVVIPPTTGGRSNVATLPAGINWNAQTGLNLVRSAGDGLWQQVHWFMREGRLIRAAGAASYTLPLPAANNEVVVLEHLQSFRLKVWQASNGCHTFSLKLCKCSSTTTSLSAAGRGSV